jgi:MtN3 and saliva related transmembrane protein
MAVHLGELTGWTSVALGQLVSWPQVMKLRRERGEGVSLASYAIVLVSMSLFLVHAVSIGDTVSTVSVPLSLIPNVLIAATLVRRRRSAGSPNDRVAATHQTPELNLREAGVVHERSEFVRSVEAHVSGFESPQERVGDPSAQGVAGRVADHESAARFQHAGHLLHRHLRVRVVMERERA